MNLNIKILRGLKRSHQLVVWANPSTRKLRIALDEGVQDYSHPVKHSLHSELAGFFASFSVPDFRTSLDFLPIRRCLLFGFQAWLSTRDRTTVVCSGDCFLLVPELRAAVSHRGLSDFSLINFSFFPFRAQIDTTEYLTRTYRMTDKKNYMYFFFL